MKGEERFGPPPDLGESAGSSVPSPDAPAPAPGPSQGVQRTENPLGAEQALEQAAKTLGLDQSLEAPPVFNTSSVSLPKSGGAISSIAEAFQANPVTGTGSTSIPLGVTPARGLEPQLALSYDSGSGAGPFGVGWALSAPKITRKTARGLPRYWDLDESDTFVLSGSEDLVPILDGGGERKSYQRYDENSVSHDVYPYRPRIEAAYSRIERWVPPSGAAHWRVRDRGNVVRIYGSDSSCRVADPADETNLVFSWLLREVVDDRGNRIFFEYISDSDGNLAPSAAAIYDQQRAGDGADALSQFTQRYLSKVWYGNATPHTVGDTVNDFLFVVAFDYGDLVDRGDSAANNTAEDVPGLTFGTPTLRPDPFSSYRAGFEIRTRYRCDRIALFHGVDDLTVPTAAQAMGTGGGDALAVRAWEFTYDEDERLSKLIGASQLGFRTESSLVEALRVPASTFEYIPAAVASSVSALTRANIDDMPRGVDSRRFQWQDLDGEGLVGILTESGGAWWYRRNLGPPERWDQAIDRPQIGPRREVVPLPSAVTLGGGAAFADLDGDGRVELVARQGPILGSHKRTDDGWEPFKAFEGMPNIDWSDPALRFVDLTGDGRADLLMTENDIHRWWPSEGRDGYGPEERVLQVLDEARAPQVVFGDDREAVYLADMTGDGLQDLVRVRVASVCYWPNLGYGRFGAKVTMKSAPLLDRKDEFDPKRVRLSDIDGSGPADLVYLGSKQVTVYLNGAGNQFLAGEVVPFPWITDPGLIDLVDLEADGTICLVKRPDPTRGPGHQLQYVPLMEQGKPHLLTRIDHGQGSETRMLYVPSTKFYVDDRDAGRPWATKLPFPVQVLERVEVRDHLREHRMVQRYAYHHGFYDGVEREFRGFGMVEQFDTERFFDLGSADWFDESGATSDDFVAPVVTKTWFHTGAWFESQTLAQSYAAEYYDGDANAASLPEPEVVDIEALTPGEIRESQRALKGRMLRQEVWAAEGDPTVPYAVSQSTYSVVLLQSRGDNQYASFRVDALSSHSSSYDQVAGDPRVTQSMVLELDDYGTPLLSAAVVFPRRVDGDFEDISISGEQQQLFVAITASEVVHFDEVATLKLSIPVRSRAFLASAPAGPATPELYTQAELLAEWTGATIDWWGTSGSTPDLHQVRDQFLRYVDESTLGGTQAALTEGTVEPLALMHQMVSIGMTRDDIDGLTGELGMSDGDLDSVLFASAEGGYLMGDVVETSGELSGFTSGGGEHAWAVSGVTTYGTSSSFFLPQSQVDPFGGATTTLTWDSYDLTILEASLDFGGTVDHEVVGAVDPQTRQPDEVTDPNGVIRQVQFDALGRVVKTRLVGDAPSSPTDSWSQPTTQMDYVFAEYDDVSETWSPGHAHAYARIEHNDIDTSTDPVDTSNTSYLQSRTYFDGLGRELMTKAQAAPDPATSSARFVGSGRVVLNNKQLPVKQYEPFFASSWDFETDAAMTGVTPELHYDPLGRLVRVDLPDGTQQLTEHAPWRTRSWDATDALPAGGTGNAWYDATADADPWELPSGTALTTPERTQIEDAIDASQSASLAWRDTPTIRHLDSLGRPFLEQRALSATTVSGNHTVTTDVRVSYDLLGRATAVDAEYRVDDGASGLMTYAQPATSAVFDILGRPLKSVGRDEQTYGQTGTTGTRYALPALDGQVVRSWDSRGNAFRSTFDGLRRPLSTFIDEGSGEYLHSHVIYGTDFDDGGSTTPQDHRLLGRPWKVFDASGELRTDEVDDDGNVREQRKWFVATFRTLPDWSGILDGVTALPAYVLDPRSTSDPEVFVMLGTFDALGRPKTETLYRGSRTGEDSTRAYTYDAGGRLVSVTASAAGQSDEDVIRSITYNARGQRLVVQKGTRTGTSDTPALITTHIYDPNTFRLLRMHTLRQLESSTDVLQDLRYVHDAVGNITLRVDGAQDTVYFGNAAATAEQTYAYDALDRLVEARGREHTSTFEEPEGGYGVRRQKNVPYGRGPVAHPNNGTALRRYTQVYAYDAVGNLAEVVHHLGNLGTVLSRRTYRYTNSAGSVVDAEAAEPFAPLFSNQLASTVVGSATYAHSYDAHGNMDLPHLVAQSWSPLDRLHSIQATASWSSDGDSPGALDPTQDHDWFYVYAADGQRARKVRAVGTSGAERSQERFYLGAFEVWREYDTNATATSAGVPETERETWHVSDDTGRMAMVETKTWVSGSVVSTPVPRWRLQLDDHLGTATGEVTEAGAVISYEEFHPYGTTAFQSVSAVDVSRKRYRYTGMERDDETGLQYHHHRYYAPWLGRWTRADPAGMVDGPARYSYVRGSPAGQVDPVGLGEAFNRFYDSGVPTVARLLGVDDRSVDEALRKDRGLGTQALIAVKGTIYLGANIATAGFVSKHDLALEQRGAGETSQNEYVSGVGVDAAFSLGTVVVGGKIGEATARLAVAKGVAPLAAAGGAGAGEGAVLNTLEQGFEIARGRQEDFSFVELGISTLAGAIFGAGGGDLIGKYDELPAVKPRSADRIDEVPVQNLKRGEAFKPTPDEAYLYVVDENDQLLISLRGDPKTGTKHTELNAGGPAKAAGELVFGADGSVMINAESGRFRAQSPEAVQRVSEHLARLGFVVEVVTGAL